MADKMQKALELPEEEDDMASGGGADHTTCAASTKASIDYENDKPELQEEDGRNDRAACTTPPTIDIDDEKRDGDGDTHCAISAAPATPFVGDENV